MVVKVAVLGAGIFARDCYLPILKRKEKEVEVVALWSRTAKTAEDTLAATPFAGSNVAIKSGELGLEEILNDPAIDACFSVLPVHVMLEITERCWKAGKHVLQEKPVAKTVAEALQSVETYRSKANPIWQFAENYRFEEVFVRARDMGQRLGKILKFDLVVDVTMNEKNKYFGSEWRRTAENCPGGFVMEGSIHFIAGLRLVAQGLGCGDIEEVSGHSANLLPEKLPPNDTATAWLRFSSGLYASFSCSYAVQQAKFQLSVVGTEGTMDIERLSPAGYVLSVKRENTEVECIKLNRFSGMDNEIGQFISSVGIAQQGAVDKSDGAWRGRPEEGVRDLAVIEALFRSSHTSGHPTSVVKVSDPQM